MADQDQKTEAPTAKRRADAARKGDLLQSRDVGAALVIAAGTAWLALAGPAFVSGCKQLLAQGLTLSRADIAGFDPAQSLVRLLAPLVLPVAALAILVLLAAVASTAALGSLGFRADAAGFKASRINPLAGLKRMFGLHGLIELGKSVIKAALLGAIGYWLMAGQARALLGLAALDVEAGAQSLGPLLIEALVALTLGLVVIAGGDVAAQIFQRNRRLRMTKEEVREEMRDTEGSPELKRAIRQRQHEVLRGSARRAVQEATVVLTNPTHFAVALRYDPARDRAPLVVARGRGETAQAIRTLAKDSSVPMLAYPQLTRAIYFTSRAGEAIAEDLYIAVATILAFVFRLDQALATGLDQPSVLVPDSKRFDEHGARQAAA